MANDKKTHYCVQRVSAGRVFEPGEPIDLAALGIKKISPALAEAISETLGGQSLAAAERDKRDADDRAMAEKMARAEAARARVAQK